MTAHWLATPADHALALALFHFLWEGAAIAAVLALALLVLKSSRARYAAACLALAAMPLAAAFTFFRVLPEQGYRTASLVLPPRPDAMPDAPVSPPPFDPATLLPYAVPVWFAGVLLLHTRTLAGWAAARRLRRSGVCAPPAEWQSRLVGLAARMRLAKPVALLESCRVDAPLVAGYLRPVILVPLDLLSGMPAGQVEAILLHELAHIRRRDYLVNLVQAVTENLLFYHPAVWWVSGIIRSEREHCCDDLVVAVQGNARDYAAALTALETRRGAAQPALAATGGNLMIRIRRLLDRPEPRHTALTPALAAILVLITAAAAVDAWQPAPDQTQTAPGPVVENERDKPEQTLPSEQQTRYRKWLNDNVASIIAEQERAAFAALALSKPAQDQPQTAPGPIAQKERQKREQKLKKELETPYRKWINEDVAYIITDQERAAFKALQTDAEREHFIEQFWERRDPTPGTAENEFKEEHYRRIAYANQHFAPATGLAGWKTDRGRVYIVYGPPDEIESHPQGGGAHAFPYEQWRYRFISGVGYNIVVEFDDPANNGEFRMTSDPNGGGRGR